MAFINYTNPLSSLLNNNMSRHKQRANCETYVCEEFLKLLRWPATNLLDSWQPVASGHLYHVAVTRKTGTLSSFTLNKTRRSWLHARQGFTNTHTRSQEQKTIHSVQLFASSITDLCCPYHSSCVNVLLAVDKGEWLAQQSSVSITGIRCNLPTISEWRYQMAT